MAEISSGSESPDSSGSTLCAAFDFLQKDRCIDMGLFTSSKNEIRQLEYLLNEKDIKIMQLEKELAEKNNGQLFWKQRAEESTKENILLQQENQDCLAELETMKNQVIQLQQQSEELHFQLEVTRQDTEKIIHEREYWKLQCYQISLSAGQPRKTDMQETVQMLQQEIQEQEDEIQEKNNVIMQLRQQLALYIHKYQELHEYFLHVNQELQELRKKKIRRKFLTFSPLSEKKIQKLSQE